MSDFLTHIGLSHYLIVSAISFALGLAIVVTRRNAVVVLMGVELILNAAALNFVAFGKYLYGNDVRGQVVAIFVIMAAAAEAAVALAITLNIFGLLRSINVDEASKLKE